MNGNSFFAGKDLVLSEIYSWCQYAGLFDQQQTAIF
jgi:hypothetical protein